MQKLADKLILKIPNWLRWLLVLPAAFLADLAAQSLYQIVFHAFPLRAVWPYCDELIWRILSPVIFLGGGLKMAPKYWFAVACLLLGFKTVIAVTNIYTLSEYLIGGGSLTAPAYITNAPVWWSLLCHALFVAFAVFFVVRDKNIRQKPTVNLPVFDF